MYRKRSLIALLLLLLTLLAACSTKADQTQPTRKKDLVWNGSAVTGLHFYQRKMPLVTVHYALPSLPTQAEKFGNEVTEILKQRAMSGQIPVTDGFDVWLIPPDQEWPKDMPYQYGSIAVGPGAIAVEDRVWSGPGARTPLITQAIGLAMNEGPGSPAYQVDWLRTGLMSFYGMGQIMYPRVPAPTTADGDLRTDLDLINNKGKGWEQAAASLAAAIVNQWGIRWSQTYHKTPAEMTPEKALLWAMGTDNLDEAFDRWWQQMGGPSGDKSGRGGGYPTLADVAPVRLQPKLAALPPGPGAQPNYSPQRYSLFLAYEPDTGVVTGEEQLVWQNGEQIPVDALYFNLWPNAERYAWYGGSLQVDAVTVDGKPATYLAQGIDLKVDLGAPAAPGQAVKVHMNFRTRLPGIDIVGAFARNGKQFSLARSFPTLAVLDDRGWNLTALPSRFGDPYSEPADYTVTVSVPTGILVGATGRQLSRDDTKIRWNYQFEAKQVTEWGAVGGPDLKEAVRTAGGITVQALDPDQEWCDKNADAALATLSYYTGLYGPLTEPHVVVTLMPGLEIPGIVSSNKVDLVGNWKSDLRNHLAHQWFGGLVASDPYSEPWLDEGLARYAEWQAAQSAG
ncbi:MAG: hypothetical protein ACM3XM_20865, partial [Mycobacterium leprae]